MIAENLPYCEAYEIDFIGLPESEAKKDATAICFRWKMSDGTIKTGVYDAGFQAHGEAMVKLINEYYFDDVDNKKARKDKKIDYVFVSHPHNDHAGGIPTIIQSFDIGCIYMNVPWLYLDELMARLEINCGRNKKKFETDLRSYFPEIDKIEKEANDFDVKIVKAFVGTDIENGLLKILSPDFDYYLDMITNVVKNKDMAAKGESDLTESCSVAEGFKKAVSRALEDWQTELLGDDHANIDEENETSIILYGFKEKDGILLTGDAGVEALKRANYNAIQRKIDLSKDAWFVEIPHHGGRHNVTTSVMNSLFGKPSYEEENPYRTAYVSVAEGSDHPRKIVVNSFLRRGFEVFKTHGFSRRHNVGMGKRKGYSKSTDNLAFEKNVEDW